MNDHPNLKFDANLGRLFAEHPFEERFDAAAEAGFTGVEYAAPYPYKIGDLARRLSDAGLTQVVINTPLGAPGSETARGAASIPDRVQEFRDGLERGLEYAVGLHSGLLHVVGGCRPEGVSHERAFARYVANIAWAAERARGTGVQLVLEMQNQRDSPRFVLESAAEAAAVVEAIGDSGVRLLFDVYHVQIQDGDVTRAFEACYPFVGHIQVADPPGRHEPGTGELSWRFLFDRIRALGYSGWIGCEYQPLADTVSGLGWLKEFGE